jgi:nitrate/TMAO reductase-like tetraheme cytochrome c subunit
MEKAIDSSGHRKRTLRRFLKAGLFIVLGVIISFPLFSISYYSMVRTSTPRFCASCHEIQFAYNTWKTSTHVNNAQGFVADCMDCHLPAPYDTFNFFYAKTAHGIKDIVIHFIQERYDHEKNRKKAYASFRNEQCQKCHRNILHIPDKRGAMLAHRSVLYPRPGYEKRCTDCHRNLVHNERALYQYKQVRSTYRGLGL